MDEDEAKVELGKSSKGGKSREKVLKIYPSIFIAFLRQIHVAFIDNVFLLSCTYVVP